MVGGLIAFHMICLCLPSVQDVSGTVKLTLASKHHVYYSNIPDHDVYDNMVKERYKHGKESK